MDFSVSHHRKLFSGTKVFRGSSHRCVYRLTPQIRDGLVEALQKKVGSSDEAKLTKFSLKIVFVVKDLVYKIKSRGGNQDHKKDLLSPHQKVPFLELQVYASEDHVLDIDSLPSPRLLSTHIPYPSLPTSLIDSGCSIVYIWRDPKAFECFCNGYSIFGPYWDHVLGYWNAKKNGANILLIKYEDLMVDPVAQLKILAEFLKLPFTEEEEEDNIIHGIITACSFQMVKDSKMYESGNTELLQVQVNNTTFLRERKTNDWENYLILKMAERLNLITVQRFADTDLI
ncbi:Aryl sulfotransferase [Zostera marina]|uniref:Sulfotransferase n=1 Tax=Zostera marina TaxID=29655 RepID=A0A0K9PJQ5_ZOSMR|nr:Aryl sulfotransferase [Zostera marina]